MQYSEIVKGYEVSSDNYVVIEDSDLENLPLPTAHAIEINEFVPQNGIQGGLYFKSAYYVEPEDIGRKPYKLLLEALGLLLGERGSTELLRTGAEELRLIGRFELPHAELRADVQAILGHRDGLEGQAGRVVDQWAAADASPRHATIVALP